MASEKIVSEPNTFRFALDPIARKLIVYRPVLTIMPARIDWT